MTDDLVKRLREEAGYWREMDPERAWYYDKSADSIEALEALLDKIEKAAEDRAVYKSDIATMIRDYRSVK